MVITPSGESTTTLASSITAVPPVPTTPADSSAIARDAQRKKDLADLQTALEEYKTKNGSYPKATDLQQTVSSQLLMTALVPNFLTAMPIDPLPSVYWYEYTSDSTSYILRAVAENSGDQSAIKGVGYYYYQLTSK